LQEINVFHKFVGKNLIQLSTYSPKTPIKTFNSKVLYIFSPLKEPRRIVGKNFVPKILSTSQGPKIYLS